MSPFLIVIFLGYNEASLNLNILSYSRSWVCLNSDKVPKIQR